MSAKIGERASRGGRASTFRLPTGSFPLRRRIEETDRRLAAVGATASDGGLAAIWEATPTRDTPRTAGIKRDTILRRTLGVVDVCAASLALVLTTALHPGPNVATLRPYVVLGLPLVVLTAKAMGLYDRDQHVLRKLTLDELPSVLYLSVLFALGIWLAEGYVIRGWLSRADVFELALSTFAFVALGRSAVRAGLSHLLPAERCLVIGDAADTARVVEKVTQAAGVKAQVVGRLGLEDDPDPRSSRTTTSLADLEAIIDVISSFEVDRVIIVPGRHDEEKILQGIRLIKAIGVKVSVLPRLLEVVGSSSVFEDLDGLALLGVRAYGLSPSSAALKRAMDVVVASLALVVLAPALALIALAIKLDSRGPILFRQRRIGLRGAYFEMLKFRSMVDGAEAIQPSLLESNEARGGLFKMSRDPRITRVGRILRRSSLDELPQLFNVLTGKMSLVGPRPLVPAEDALIEGWQRRRSTLKPGMTGKWQVYGSARIPMDEMVKIDYLYGANWSLWLDLKILLCTVPYVLRRRGM